MPSSAIESANAGVKNVISQWSQGSGSRKGIKYIVYSTFLQHLMLATKTSYTVNIFHC